MNTEKTSTSMDTNSAVKGSSKKVVRDPNILYKNDRITVYATGEGRVKRGTVKELHPHFATQMIEKGYYSEDFIPLEGARDEGKKKGKKATPTED